MKKPLKNILKKRFPFKNEKELFAMILCGEVLVNNEKNKNPNINIDEESDIKIKKEKKYVSRGGIKLNHALKVFNIDVKDRIFIDAGCSTGGFTDCLLKKKAKYVYSVDVGYNVLDYKIRTDKRVKVFERTNIMQLYRKNFQEIPHAAVMDLSFRSITGAVSHIMNLIKDKIIISLIKPQFELLKPYNGFNGIVKDKKELYNILKIVIDAIALENCFPVDITESPILGRKGNHEYFFLIKDKKEKSKKELMEILEKVILKRIS